jgi:Flp pilus assembly protein TadD
VPKPGQGGQVPEQPEAKESELITQKESERDMYVYQARSLEEIGDLGTALEYLKKAVSLDPNNYKIRTKMANICVKLKDAECAVTNAKTALDYQPGYVPAMVNYGIGLALMGRDLDAEEVFRDALSRNPANVEILRNLAVLYEKRGEMEAAHGIYLRLAELKVQDAYLGLARVLEKMERFHEAADIYNMICLNSDSEALKRYAIERLRVLTPLLNKN